MFFSRYGRPNLDAKSFIDQKCFGNGIKASNVNELSNVLYKYKKDDITLSQISVKARY